MEHLADELDSGWLVRVLLFKVHHQPECSVLKWSICGAYNNGIPRPATLDIDLNAMQAFEILTMS